MKILLVLVLCLQLSVATLEKDEAVKAYTFLNDIRVNPDKYVLRFPFIKNEKVRKTKLIWNDTLARVAEAKALDMANKNYFAHVDPLGYGMNYYINKAGYKLNADWLKDKRENNFESIVAGIEDGEEAIAVLIMDEGVPSLGHRIHLLGLDEDFDVSLKDIGIGFARRKEGGEYTTYVSVIIAMHDWE